MTKISDEFDHPSQKWIKQIEELRLTQSPDFEQAAVKMSHLRLQLYQCLKAENIKINMAKRRESNE